MSVKDFPRTEDVRKRQISQGRDLHRKLKALGLQLTLGVEMDFSSPHAPFLVTRLYDGKWLWRGRNRDTCEAFIYGVWSVYEDYV
jgi:hypothetical protein